MQVFVFCEFGFKMPIHISFLFFETLTPYIGRHINKTSKRNILVRKDVLWRKLSRIDGQNRSNGATSARDEVTKKGKEDKERNRCVAGQTTYVVVSKSNSARDRFQGVLHFKFHENWLMVSEMWGWNLSFPNGRPLAYITARTIVRAMETVDSLRSCLLRVQTGISCRWRTRGDELHHGKRVANKGGRSVW